MDKPLPQGLITAHLFMENGDLAGAKRILTTLPPEYYDDPCQLLMLARVVCLEVQEPEDFAEVITIFRQVARAGSLDASILVNVAALALKIGYRDEKHAVRERVVDHRLALDAARQAIAVEPKLPVSYLIAARLIINLTLYESGGAELESLEAEAKAHLGQAETVGADPASVATLRVALMLVLGQLDAAREFLTDTHPQPRAVVVLRDYLAELDRPLTDRDRADMAQMWAELREFLASFPHFMARMGLSEDDDFADLRGCMLMQAALDLLDDDYGASPMLLPPEGRQLLHDFHKHTIIVKSMAQSAAALSARHTSIVCRHCGGGEYARGRRAVGSPASARCRPIGLHTTIAREPAPAVGVTPVASGSRAVFRAGCAHRALRFRGPQRDDARWAPHVLCADVSPVFAANRAASGVVKLIDEPAMHRRPLTRDQPQSSTPGR